MMKKLIIFFTVSILVLSFASCENDMDDMYIKTMDSVTAPVLKTEGFTQIVADDSNINFAPVIFNWTKSDFGEDVLVEYSLEMATDETFKDSYVVTVGNNIYSKAPTCSELSKWAIDEFNGLDENEMPVKVDLFMRIVATVALENPTVTIPPGKVYSNAVGISVVPHYIPDAYPAEMFMIGVEFGNWNWSDAGVVVMNPVNGYEGNFWAIRYITAGNGFKWCAKREWTGDFKTLGEDIGFYTDGGDAFVEADGLYMIFIDMVNNRISVEPAKVYGMGDCFGGWDMGKYPFETDGKTMKITTAAAGELRMYAASDISPIGGEWWRMEFIPMDGVIEYRGNGPDQDRINEEAGKTVTLDFNTESASIK